MGWPGMQLPFIFSISLVTVYFLSYPQAFLSFLFFTYQFPSLTISEKMLKFGKSLFQSIGSILSLGLLFLYFQKTFKFSLSTLALYHMAYRIFRIFIFLIFLMALFIIVRNLLRAPNPVNRRKVQWILWGIIWGSFPFIFLWSLPQIFISKPLIPEWIYYIFLLFTPAGVAIAILKYRLFDIEIVLSRSLVYGLVIISLIGTYLISIGGLSLIIFQQFKWQSPILSIFTALVIALLFNPLKNNIQIFVNRKFFRIRYHRFKSLETFMRDLEACGSEPQVLNLLESHFQDSIPLQSNMFLKKKNGNWKIYSSQKRVDKSFKAWLGHDYSYYPENLYINSRLREKVEPSDRITMVEMPEPWVLFIPLSDAILWLLAEKRAKTRFWIEDLELALHMSRAACLQIEKLNYIQLSIREAIEREQAQKLSKWKSLLVAEVAHDLRAPLNTMLWKLKNAEKKISQNQEGPQRPIVEIQQQIFRLQGFIQSMLIFSDKEHGKLDIKLQPLAINAEILQVLNNLEGVITQKNLKVDFSCDPNIKISADPIIFQEIILNLIQNAAKFSPQNSNISLRVQCVQRRKKDKVLISIEDEAGGISATQLKKLFEPFRESKDLKDSEKGFHLGMYIVNEFTRLLKGEIKVKSVAGKGTKIELYFPVISEN